MLSDSLKQNRTTTKKTAFLTILRKIVGLQKASLQLLEAEIPGAHFEIYFISI